ncbi:trypsin-like peptidase domain-containing protein [Paracoccaceae bacterium]|nr:trypsin-like peptidase domain-containing protein [Paracoccaceae bacterium]
MSNYKDTVFADIGRSVGRLDVLTDKGTFPCTAFIVSKQHILTNYHCSLGLLDDERIGATRIDASQFVAGYTQTGVDEGTKKFTVIPTPVETNAELDYAVLEVIGNPSQEFGELKLASLVPNDRAPFWIIGHPQGKGQHISREKCRASTPAISRNTLLHTCDTLPGNSGSPVIDAGLQQVVALHHAGIANDSVNAAILMSKILENSTVLAAYKAPEDVPKSQPIEPKTAANSACDTLYSAAAEAKACFAFKGYMKQCASHVYAPIAQSYLQEFCKPQETVKVDKVPAKTCDDDPSLCSTDQLCGQSLTFKSGKPAWRMDNVSYVTEAKRRRLTCGVTVVVAKPEKICSEDAKVCDDSQICILATSGGLGQKVWGTQSRWKKHVAEAKRRELNCGVIEVVAAPKKTCAEDVTVCSASQICPMAIYYSSGAKAWRLTGKHVTEAKRRGLTCGVTKVVAAPEKICSEDINICNNSQICILATNGGLGQKVWGTQSRWKEHVAEAKRRGLSCGVAQVVAAPEKTCSEDVTVCSESQLCPMAVYYTAGAKVWRSTGKYVTEAKRRGMTCGVTKAVAKPANKTEGIFSKAHFTKLGRTQRKQLQYGLKQLGYYSSSIDGLWGKGTNAGVNSFAKDRNLSSSFPNSVFDALASEVAFENMPVTDPVSEKTTVNTNELVCELENPEAFDAIEKEAQFQVFSGELARPNLSTLKLSGNKLMYGRKHVISRGSSIPYWIVQANSSKGPYIVRWVNVGGMSQLLELDVFGGYASGVAWDDMLVTSRRDAKSDVVQYHCR